LILLKPEDKVMATNSFIDIYGSKMHYLENGSGDPILFLHDMPTSSYIWHKLILQLSPLGHCIAPDLIGMGQSDKPDIQYTIADHINYVEKFIETLNLKNITFVMHGWGSVVGSDIAMRNEKNCKGLVFYESYVRAVTDDAISLPFQEQIITLDKENNLQEKIENSPYLVEKLLSQSTLQPLSLQDMDVYKKSFLKRGSGKVLYQYWCELPRGNEKDKINKLIEIYSLKLTQSKLPKLMLYSLPGFITTLETVMWAKTHLQNVEVSEVGEELHYAQETNPELMGQIISAWLQGIEALRVYTKDSNS
jgi:haloalkane dehalogenase